MPGTNKHPFSNWHALSQELKRRRVYSVVAAYAVVAFVVLQIGEITFVPLGIPNWVMITLIALVVAGFPIVMLLAWMYVLTPKGLRKEHAGPAEAAMDDDTPSVAVLPFADLSPEQDQGFFCEGVAEEILNALTRLGLLNVAARSSSFTYDVDPTDVREVGRELGVDAVLQGSVRKAGERVRVTAKLVDTHSGYHRWSKSFDEHLKDVFAIQDEIATAIAEALLETLSPEQHAHLRTGATANVDAYEYYLRGRQFFKRFRKRDMEYARQMFRQAIEIDAAYARAWAGYADCHSFLVMYADPNPEYRERARDASARAVDLDPQLAEAHAARGLAHLVCEDYEAAEGEFERALELNASLFEAYYYFARTRFHQGRLEEAIELFRRAFEVDPADYQSRCLRIQVLRGMGRVDEARSEARDALQVLERHMKWNPDDARAYHLGAGTLVVLGEVERAKRWLHQAIEIDSDDPVVLYNVACNLATLGEVDSAITYLEKAIEFGTISAAWMRNDEDLANLRDDVRFQELVRRLDQVEQ